MEGKGILIFSEPVEPPLHGIRRSGREDSCMEIPCNRSDWF